MNSTNDLQHNGEDLRDLVISWIGGDTVDDKNNNNNNDDDDNGKTNTDAKTPHPQTCEWIFEHDQFRTWLKSMASTSLLFSAPPGAGKTVSAFAVASYLKELGLTITTFDFSFKDPSKRTTIAALRALALELLKLNKSVPDAVLELYQSETRHRSSQLDDVVVANNLIKALIKQISRVHIILDGIDECHDRKVLLPILGSLVESPTHGIVKWFLTSRPERDIREQILRHTVLEIEAPVDSIKSDINKFLQGNHISRQWMHKIDAVVEKSAGNFLWATMAIEILNNTSFTDEKHLEDELDKFPRDLNSLYLRTLHRLSKRKRKWQQELARKTFTFLLASFQPLRLSELLDALATNRSSDRYPPPLGQPEASLLEDLCSGLVVFDRSRPGYTEDPLLHFIHKSVHDFFVQILNPGEVEELGIHIDGSLYALDAEHFERKMREHFKKFLDSQDAPEDVEPFFTSKSTAHAELGQICLQYLSNARYNKPGLQAKFLGNRDHAFLRYAAVFWHAHLSLAKPTSKIIHQVETFMRSSAFWNCVEIQSVVAPHLYAIYLQGQRSLRYLEAIPQLSAESRPANIHYASPLPQWMTTSRAEDFDVFITQWCRVLNSHPGKLRQCYMDDQWSSKWPNMSGWLSDHVNCRTVHSSDMTMDDLISEEIQKKRRQKATVPNASESAVNSRNTPLDSFKQDEIHAHECQDYSPSDCLKCLMTFPTKLVTDIGEVADSKTSVSRPSPEAMSNLSEWEAISYTSNLRTMHDSPKCGPRAVAVQWRAESEGINDPMRESEEDSISIASDSQSGSDSDSNTGSDSDSDSDQDDDPSLQANRSAWKVASPHHQHCFLVTRENASPISYLWRSTYRNHVTRGVFHPTKPWVLWSPSAHLLCKTDITTGLIEQTALPEPPEIDFASLESLHKELYISENGSVLFYLVFAVTPTITGAHCHLCVTPLELVLKRDEELELRSSGSPSTLSFVVDEVLEAPLVLAAWTPDHVYIALPSISCRPKIVRLPLRMESQNHRTISSVFQALQEPIFFPFTTPDRHPRLLVDGHGGLVMTLAAPLTLPVPQEDAIVIGSCEKVPDRDNGQSPTTITWPSEHISDWRDWDESTDGIPERVESARDKIRRLRGSYIASDQRFHVTVRSSLNYYTKEFVSCF